MADLRGSSISIPEVKIQDVPDAPSVSATDVGTSRAYNNGAATVTVTNAATGGRPISYTVTSTPGSLTATGASPLTVTGLSSATSYTFTATATNAAATSPASSASASITATTVPQAPTIGTFTDGGTGTSGTLSFTAGATGGSSITAYKYSTDGTNYTTASGTTSPLSITGLTPATYTFRLRAANANGDSLDSGTVSGTVIQPTAFESIASTVPTGSSTVTFSSIPSTYKHLQLRIFANDGGGNNIIARFNSDTGTNYTRHRLSGDGTSAAASGLVSQDFLSIADNNASSNSYLTAAVYDIHDYASTTKYKTAKGFSGYDANGSGYVALYSGLWLSTSAITSISVSMNSTWSTGSVIALYGIKGA